MSIEIDPRPVNANRKPVRSAYDAVLRGIGYAIVAGEFPVGRTLPGKEILTRRFGVSNTVLREVLKTLEAKGMVAARTRVGYWVADEDNWNLLDEDLLGWRLEAGVGARFIGRLFEMRQAIEPAAAALAASRRTPAQSARLAEFVDTMARSGFDRQHFTSGDVAFHLLVLEASGNPMMRSVGALVGAALEASFQLSAPTDSLEMVDQSCRQHSAIAQAIEAGKPQEAADAMLVVIDQGWSTFRSPGKAIAMVPVRRLGKD